MICIISAPSIKCHGVHFAVAPQSGRILLRSFIFLVIPLFLSVRRILRQSATSESCLVRASLHFWKEVVSECIQTGLQRIGRPSRKYRHVRSLQWPLSATRPFRVRSQVLRSRRFWADRAKSHLVCSLSERKTTKSDSAWMRGVSTLSSMARRVLSRSPPKDVNLEYVEGACGDGDSWIIPQEVGEEAVSEVVPQALLLRDRRRPMVLSLDRDKPTHLLFCLKQGTAIPRASRA